MNGYQPLTEPVSDNTCVMHDKTKQEGGNQ